MDLEISEVITCMEEEIQHKTEYTHDEKYSNYCILVDAITDIQNNNITREWIVNHSHLIMRYRDWIHDYSKVSPEIDDKEFRIRLSGIESFLNILCDQLRKFGKFDIGIYYRLNQYIKYVIDHNTPISEEDELVNLISGMKVTST